MVFILGADDELSLARASTAPWQKTGVQNAVNRVTVNSNRRFIENIGFIVNALSNVSSIWSVVAQDVDLHPAQLSDFGTDGVRLLCPRSARAMIRSNQAANMA